MHKDTNGHGRVSFGDQPFQADGLKFALYQTNATKRKLLRFEITCCATTGTGIDNTKRVTILSE